MVANAQDHAKPRPTPRSRCRCRRRSSYPTRAPLDYYMDAVRNDSSPTTRPMPGDPAEVLGATEQARANALYRGGLKIYTNYDPYMQFAASIAISRRSIPKISTVHRVARRRSTTPTAACARSPTAARYDASQFDPAVDGPGRQAGLVVQDVHARRRAEPRLLAERPVERDLAAAGGSVRATATTPSTTSHGDCHGGTPPLTAGDRDLRQLRVRAHRALARPRQLRQRRRCSGSSRWRTRWASTRRSFEPGRLDDARHATACTRSRWRRRTRCSPNDGVLKRATFVTKIVGASGKVLYQSQRRAATGARPERRAHRDRDAEGRVEARHRRAALSASPRPAAGKTGTTDNNVDAWFVGFTPQYTAAVWMGDPAGETPMTNVGGISVFGATYPAEIWRAFMEDGDREPAAARLHATRRSSSGRVRATSASTGAGSRSVPRATAGRRDAGPRRRARRRPLRRRPRRSPRPATTTPRTTVPHSTPPTTAKQPTPTSRRTGAVT